MEKMTVFYFKESGEISEIAPFETTRESYFDEKYLAGYMVIYDCIVVSNNEAVITNKEAFIVKDKKVRPRKGLSTLTGGIIPEEITELERKNKELMKELERLKAKEEDIK